MIDTHETCDLFGHSPNTPGHRGVDTSVEAAKDIAPHTGRLQSLVLAAIRDAGAYGRTTNEIADHLEISRDSIQPRTSELRKNRVIVDSGQRRKNANGKSAIVWTLAGLEVSHAHRL